MTSIENSELDFSELEYMSEMELDIYFNMLISQNSSYLSFFDDQDFIDSIDSALIIEARAYYEKILELFIDWELFDYIEDIHLILIKLYIAEQNLKK